MSRPRTKNKHLPKYVTIIHGAYWYRPPNVKPKRLAAVGDEATLYKEYARYAFPSDAEDTGKVADYLDRYEREIVPTLAERTQRDYHKYLATLREHFGHFHPNDIRPKDVGRFMDVPKGKIHRARIVAVLSACYSHMVGSWYVADRNPCLQVKRPKNPPRDRYITDEEFNAIHAVMPIRQQIAMELAYLCGQRQGDVLKLKWEDCTEDGVIFRQSKTGQGRLVLYSDKLRDILTRAAKIVPQIPREYVVHTRKGTRYSSAGFRACWQRVMKRSMEQGLLKKRFTFHDIRAKTVSDEDNVDTAQLRAGHTSKAMTLRVYSRKIRKVTALR